MNQPSVRPRIRPSEIYLDSNATTPVLPIAAAAAMQCMQQQFGNPSSSHTTGIKAKATLEHARNLARQLTGAGDGHILFTSGATEGIQSSVVSALLALREQGKSGPATLLLYGATEHKAVPESLKHWNTVLQLDATIKAIPVDNNGQLDLTFISDHAPAAGLICTMAANNETGIKQPLAELEACIRNANPSVYWLVDCVQALGKMSLQLATTTIDYAPFSGHKLYAPKGVGFLYVRSRAPYQPFIIGGGQEGGLRSGTENLPGIAALGAVLAELQRQDSLLFQSEQTLWYYREKLLAALRYVFPALVLNSEQPYIVPTTVNFSVPGFFSKDIMDLFDAAGIRISSGSACSSKVPSSFVLDAMGLADWRSQGAIRLSFGPAMTPVQCNDACTAIKGLKAVVNKHCLVVTDATPTLEIHADGLLQLKHEDCCSYLLIDAGNAMALIIDPVPALVNRIINIVQGRQLQVLAILETHLHAEQQSAAALLRQTLNVNQQNADAFGWPAGTEQLAMATMQLTRLATPGHCASAISIILRRQQQVLAAFVGDVILPGGIGRTDLADGDAGMLQSSILLLAEHIEHDSLLLSSHDYAQRFATTLQLAQQESELFAKVLAGLPAATWQQQLNEQTARLQNASHYYCGLVEVTATDANRLLDKAELTDILAQQPDLLVVDVREPHEQTAGPLQRHLPAAAQVLAVPLSKLCDALISRQLTPARPLLLVCRSGNRSLLACKVLRRFGFTAVYNLNGGMAMLV
ncbi:aminotransferase class V-fold PLP-dependent enzyme [Arsukibacterium indicum]|uniref:Aminotransferase class V-fold PLP-dependent enzyme n=1 Tax=Arsukibacterium indicum TaxID=2848612 RepID=A0ABS6MFR3_9GAMM|nr:aminotransferase class V-fold PLP-dependent enzyme [Arsukibacterium indicum]MBV2127649.1 aminotransferase class V-fold PLP-dependent enzyme [Arsukibacterium indicum]